MADQIRPRVKSENLVWSVPLLEWVAMGQPVISTDNLSVTTNATALSIDYGNGSGLVHAGIPNQGVFVSSVAGLVVMFDYDGGTNPVYIGSAEPGNSTSDVAWQIRKITYDGSDNITSILFAFGTTTFGSVWDNRASYPYS